MSIVITIAAVAIIGGIVVVAKGLGGELARDRAPQPELDVRTGSDVARYRPPPALLGYQPEDTERAFSIIGRSIAERDEEIAWLRGRLAELQPETGPAMAGGQPAGSATASLAVPEPTDLPDSAEPATDADGSEDDGSDTGPAVRGAASPQR